MTALESSLVDYLALRRSLGYKLERGGELLEDFVAYLDRAGADHVTVELAVAWATLPANPESGWRAQRLGVARCFARYLNAIDPRHEVPPTRLLPPGTTRPAPYLYSEAEIARLMAAARSLRTRLYAATIETVIGLLAVSGLRVGELIRLDRDDVDFGLGVLIVRNSKAGKSRMVPLHPTSTEALKAYALERDSLRPGAAPSFFISTAGTRLLSGNLNTVFNEMLGRAGLPLRSARKGPRLADLRHSFAVSTVLDWHQSAAEVQVSLPLLSSFLGHANPVSTYWYLSASPELLVAAAARLDTAGAGS
jgi:integrase/recombinase XerD